MKITRRQLLRAMGLTAGAACAAALTGCGSASSTPAVSSSAAASSSAAVDPNAMQLTLTPNVAEVTYTGVKDFDDFLAMAEPKYLIPGLVENQIPQGICRSEATGKIYVSAYSSIKLASVIMVLDADGSYVAEYQLKTPGGSNFTGHVGGIAVTDTTVYLSNTMDSDGSYSVAMIPLDSLAETGKQDVAIENSITVPVSPSLLSYSDGILWVGNFYHPLQDYDLSPEMNYTTPNANNDGSEYGCYILGYDLTEQGDARMQPADGADYAIPDHVLACPWKIQGMVCDPVNGVVVLSQSYGRKNNSALLRYTVDLAGDADTTVELAGQTLPCFVLDRLRQTHEITAIPMTEGLTLTADRDVLVLFESGANKYADGKYRTDHIWLADFDKAE